MPVPFIPFPGLIIRSTSYVFGSIMKKYYTKERLSSLVKIEISSEHSGITVNCSELPDVSAWIVITNCSPFHIFIHEIEAELYLSDRVARLVSICNEDISPSAKERLFVQTDLTEKQVEYIKRKKGVETPMLKIKMLLNNRLSSFEIHGREISIDNIVYINCNDS